MLMLRDAVRKFVDKEIRPNIDELEHGDLPPYDILRKLYATFGMDTMAKSGSSAASAARPSAAKRSRPRGATAAAARVARWPASR